MSDKTIGDYDAANSIDASNDYYLLEQSGVYKKINRNVGLGISGSPIGDTDTQSLSNKTIGNTNSITVKDGSLTIQNSSSTTKQAVFSASGITAGQTRTFTFPDASGTLTTNAGTQTLTNKTLTSPTITGGSIDNSTITVDSISGHTSGTLVTVANLQISNGVLNSANAVTSTSIAAGAIQPQALVSGTGSGWSWQSYTPTFGQTTLGNGTVAGGYIQIGKTVFFRASFVLGSTSAVSTNPTVTLPVTASSSGMVSTVTPIGVVICNDAGTNSYDGVLAYSSTTIALLTTHVVTGSFTRLGGLTASGPFTFGSADGIYVEGFYEAA